MQYYPEELLPRKLYPILNNDVIKNNTLVRETETDLYQLIENTDCETDDILPFVVSPQPSLREVFELSTFLYGYYTDEHIGIRVADSSLYTDWNNEMQELAAKDIEYIQEKAYPFYLSAKKLDRQEIDFNGDIFNLSFSHKPTRVNYWHFELWINDNKGNRIPRDKSSAHIKYLAKAILEYIIAEAVQNKSSIIPFKDEFDLTPLQQEC